MKKFAQVSRETGECFHIVCLQGQFAYEEGQDGPDNTFYTEVPMDTNDQNFLSTNYWKDGSWQERSPCPGEYYYWRNEEWVYDDTFLWQSVKGKRNALLNSSDWTQIADAPLTEEAKESWRAYRQQLRDLPENQSDITTTEQVIWPDTPS